MIELIKFDYVYDFNTNKPVRNYDPNVCPSDCMDFQTVSNVKVLALEYPNGKWIQITPQTQLSSNCCMYLTCILCHPEGLGNTCKCRSSLHTYCTDGQKEWLLDQERMKRVTLPMDEFIMPTDLGHCEPNHLFTKLMRTKVLSTFGNSLKSTFVQHLI